MTMLLGPVLVAVDASEGAAMALREADAYAIAKGVELVACVVQPLGMQARPLFPQRNAEEALRLAELEEGAREAVVELIRQHTGRKEGSYRLELASGPLWRAIERLTELLGAGRVVLPGGDGKGPPPGTRRAAVRVLRRTSAGLLLVRKGSATGQVLAGTDLSDGSWAALEEASAEARRRGASLTVLHAVDPGPGPLLGEGAVAPGGFSFSPFARDPFEEALAQARERLLHGLRRHGIEARVEVELGRPAEHILRSAATLPAELVVLGTAGRSGLPRLVLGSCAETVLRKAPMSVLVTRGTGEPARAMPPGEERGVSSSPQVSP